MDGPNTSLGWLHPAVDRCRDILAQRVRVRHWTKPSAHDGADETVTDLDLAVEAILIEEIRTRLPHVAIVSEESHPDLTSLTAETCFVIDPIDGTNELLAGRSGFAISIALFDHGRPVAALVDMPAQNRRFEGAAGAGTRLNGEPVALASLEALTQARLAVSATQLRNESLQGFWSQLPAAALAPTPGFAAKFAAVLSSDCDAALYLPVKPHPAAIWDYAAPALLLTEAGGTFTSLDGVNLLRTQPSTYVGGWVAGSPTICAKLIAVLRRAPPDW